MTTGATTLSRHRFVGMRLAVYWLVTVVGWSLVLIHSIWWVLPACFGYLIRPETAAESAARMRRPAASVFLFCMSFVLLGTFTLPINVPRLPVYLAWLLIFFGYYFVLDLIWFGYLPRFHRR